MSLQIRRARREDLAALIAMERGIAEAPHWAEVEYAAMLDGLGGVQRLLVVAEIGDNGLVGFAVGKIVGRESELESVAVAAGTRRSGVGGALCAAVVEWCREEGADVVELEVRSASDGAIALYKGLGFSAVGLRKKYYRDPVDDAVLMHLMLSE